MYSYSFICFCSFIALLLRNVIITIAFTFIYFFFYLALTTITFPLFNSTNNVLRYEKTLILINIGSIFNYNLSSLQLYPILKCINIWTSLNKSSSKFLKKLDQPAKSTNREKRYISKVSTQAKVHLERIKSLDCHHNYISK